VTLIYFRFSKMTVKLETLIVLLSNIFLIKIHGFNNHYRKDITSLCSYMTIFEIYIPQTTHYMWRDRARVDRCISTVLTQADWVHTLISALRSVFSSVRCIAVLCCESPIALSLFFCIYPIWK
jgi:hypothetical protein